MITTDYVKTMANYNRWQNQNIYQAAAQLSDHDRRRDEGAFFASVFGTLNHILWADRVWMSRFAQFPAPSGGMASSTRQYDEWTDLAAARQDMDKTIGDWADGLDDGWLASDLTWYSGLLGREVTKKSALLVTHMFNHQTHHRGQVHALLTRLGIKPQDTDLMLMPEA